MVSNIFCSNSFSSYVLHKRSQLHKIFCSNSEDTNRTNVQYYTIYSVATATRSKDTDTTNGNYYIIYFVATRSTDTKYMDKDNYTIILQLVQQLRTEWTHMNLQVMRQALVVTYFDMIITSGRP